MKKVLSLITVLAMAVMMPLTAFAGTLNATLVCKDSNGDVISNSPAQVEVTTSADGSYVVTAPTITGYVAKSATKTFTSSEWTSGDMANKGVTLEYNFENQGKYVVTCREVTASGNAVIEGYNKVVKYGSIGKDITVKAPTVPGYTLDLSDRDEKTIALESRGDDNLQEVCFDYFKDENASSDASVVTYYVRYEDEDGNELANTVEKTGTNGDTVTLKAKKFDGYKVFALNDEEISSSKINVVLDSNDENVYVFTYKKVGASASDGKGDGPKTGDAGLILYGLMSLGSLGGAGFGIKRKFFK